MPELTYNDTLSAYESYSKAIRPFLLRADTHPQIRAILSKSHLRILIDLLSRARIRNPDKEIKAKLENVASDLSVDRRTVTRAISTFFNLGWLLPSPGYDGRNRRGRYAAQQYLISPTLRDLVGLPLKETMKALQEESPPAPGNTATEEAAVQPSNETEMSHGLLGVNKSLLKKEASFNTEAQKPAGLPADLRPIQRELGIEHKGMCALMKLAKEMGQRLQDVLLCKKHLLIGSGMTGGRAVNYIKSLLRSGDDFAYVARTRFAGPGRLNGSQVIRNDQLPAKSRSGGRKTGLTELEAIAVSSRFKRFRHVARTMVVQVYDGSADVINGAVRSTYYGDQMEGIYKGIAAGNLVEVSY